MCSPFTMPTFIDVIGQGGPNLAGKHWVAYSRSSGVARWASVGGATRVGYWCDWVKVLMQGVICKSCASLAATRHSGLSRAIEDSVMGLGYKLIICLVGSDVLEGDG